MLAFVTTKITKPLIMSTKFSRIRNRELKCCQNGPTKFELKCSATNLFVLYSQAQADFNLADAAARWVRILCPTNTRNTPKKPSSFSVWNRSNCTHNIQTSSFNLSYIICNPLYT